jgi:hypothetical protein
MRILRHEAAMHSTRPFRLHFKRRHRELFGSFAQPYPDFYQAETKEPSVRTAPARMVRTAPPAEDFAETFAVWLTPRLQWRRRYKGWPRFASSNTSMS